MREFQRVAIAAARSAGALIRDRFGGAQDVSYKGEVDLVTAVDRAAEGLIVDAIRGAFPDHGIIAEESGASNADGRFRWYVDPLDGTTNFAHGYPHVAVSIALVRDDELAVGVVHDPLRGETFTAVRGEGARLDDRPIHVSSTADFGRALLATGFPYDRRQRAGFYLAFTEAALREAQCVRRGGSAALDLCYVAAGRLDGFWEWKLKPWDTAAGRLIVEEAGGRVTDFAGGPHDLGAPQTAASNGRLHEALVAMLTTALCGRRDA